MRIERIRALAVQFRRACELADKTPLFRSLENFPHGSCGDASLMLAHHLGLHGFGDFEYISARFGDRNHSWIEQDGLVVDITADQFEIGLPAVIVSETSEWHAALTCERPYTGGDDWTIATLRQYSHVIKWLPA